VIDIYRGQNLQMIQTGLLVMMMMI